jgi:tetrahydromethanopterin S-methyltransferase subunit E
MSADLSVRNYSPIAQRAADALLRSLGGSSVGLQMPATTGAGDAAQIGITPQSYQQLPLAPALFRRVRTPMVEGEPVKFELAVSASAVAVQVGALQLSSADALFAQAAGIVVNGKLFLIEAVTAPEAFGQAYLYRLQLREALPQSI